MLRALHEYPVSYLQETLRYEYIVPILQRGKPVGKRSLGSADHGGVLSLFVV